MNLPDFYKEITRILGEHFIREDQIWKHEFEVQTQGQIMIINGQRVERPGETLKVCSTVEIISIDDYIENEDGSKEMLINISCERKVNGQHVICEGFLCHYENETELDPLLNEFLTKIFLK